MAMITVQVWDATGNKRQTVGLPDDAAVNRILDVEKMPWAYFILAANVFAVLAAGEVLPRVV